MQAWSSQSRIHQQTLSQYKTLLSSLKDYARIMNSDKEQGRNGLLLGFIDIITVLSFMLQIQNNEELYRQATNNDIIDNMHKDINTLYEGNRRLLRLVLDKEEEILRQLEKVARNGENDEQEQD